MREVIMALGLLLGLSIVSYMIFQFIDDFTALRSGREIRHHGFFKEIIRAIMNKT